MSISISKLMNTTRVARTLTKQKGNIPICNPALYQVQSESQETS
jgi:hypothetical protein